VSVPTLVVGGWWDQEDLYGAITTYKILESFDKQELVSFVEGPWRHGGWGTQGRNLAGVDFGGATGRYYRKNIEAPWFAFYLKGKGERPTTEAYIFQSGSNRWMSYDAWPPKQIVRDRELYFQCGHLLSFEKTKTCDNDQGFDSYVSDPANPVPYRKRPIEATYDPKGSNWYTWLAQDQQFLKDRADLLSYETPTLNENVTLTGDIFAHLFASTTGTDSDWVVKLIDEYPEDGSKMSGYQFMIAGEIFRGRYLTSFENPKPLVRNRVTEYTIDLHGNDHVFLKGHRIMVQVQSSWFPLYDRNPQKFVENIFLAKPADFQAATQRVYYTDKYPSRVSVEVADRPVK
jgi:putative CocE/NonD family hydrolase